MTTVVRVRFKGRGGFQLTGRANYRKYGKEIGVDLEGNPSLVATKYFVDVAGWFWGSRGLNGWADKDELETITRRVNGGLNGIDDRRSWLNKLKSVYKIG